MLNQTRKDIIEEAIRDILVAIGEDAEREGLRETPKRVAEMFGEIFEGVGISNERLIELYGKIFLEDDKDDPIDKFGDMVIVKNIPFYSMCEHHLVPFHGTASVGYIPNNKVIGLSKIARLLETVSKRPQLQERITKTIAEAMDAILEPKGVMVVIKAEHLCMSMRGIKKPGSVTVTSAAKGVFKYDPATRNEFLQLLGV